MKHLHPNATLPQCVLDSRWRPAWMWRFINLHGSKKNNIYKYLSNE